MYNRASEDYYSTTKREKSKKEAKELKSYPYRAISKPSNGGKKEK
jgi:hypothetical protein